MRVTGGISVWIHRVCCVTKGQHPNDEAPRVCVPAPCRGQVLRAAHGGSTFVGHPGVHRTTTAVRRLRLPVTRLILCAVVSRVRGLKAQRICVWGRNRFRLYHPYLFHRGPWIWWALCRRLGQAMICL